MNDQLIISNNDIRTALTIYREFVKTTGTSYEEMEAEDIAKIEEDVNLTQEQKNLAIKNTKGIYAKTELALFKQMFIQYIQNLIMGSQVELENVYNLVNEKLDEFEAEFNLGLTNRNKLEVGFEVNKIVFQALSTFTTMNYDDREKELIAEYAEKQAETLKKNRAFGRDTEAMDSMENK